MLLRFCVPLDLELFAQMFTSLPSFLKPRSKPKHIRVPSRFSCMWFLSIAYPTVWRIAYISSFAIERHRYPETHLH